MTAYETGVRLEKRIAKHLRGEGYYCLESRGSHGLIDVVAVKLGQILGVQAKGNGVLGPTAWNELYDACRHHGMVPLLGTRDGRKLIFWELTGPKVPYSRTLPRRPFVTDLAA